MEGLGHTILVSLDEDEAAAFAASLTDVLRCTVAAFPSSSASRDAFLRGGYTVASADVARRVVAALKADRDYGGELVVKLHK